MKPGLFSFLVFFTVFSLQGKGQSIGNNQHTKPARSFADHSVLMQGNWYRLGVSNTGIQKITYNDLASMGVSLPVESSKLRIFGNGGKMLPEMTSSPRPDDLLQLSVFVVDHGDGSINTSGDYILFYAEGPDTWTYNATNKSFGHQKHLYSDYAYYFLNTGTDNGLRTEIVSSLSSSPDDTITKFQDHLFHERDSINLMRTGKIWLGEVFNDQLSYTFHFSLPDISLSDTVRIRTSLAARSSDSNYFHISAWGNTTTLFIEPTNPNVNTDIAKIALSDWFVEPVNEDLYVGISYDQPDETSTGWLNYIEVNGMRNLVYHGGQLDFRNSSASGAGIAEYSIQNVPAGCRLWKVTDPSHTKEISLNLSGSQASFRWNTDSLHEFVLFDTTQFFTTKFVEQIANQDLHGTAFPDLIIVTHPDFRAEAERLASFHRNIDGLDVMVTEPQIIYNEFSSGMQDPAAIRDFMRMLFIRADSDTAMLPRYLLLFGDGSYDMKNRLAPNTNFIPTYQTWNSTTPTSSFVSDDFFGLLTDGEGVNAAGLLDAGVGRLPAATVTEAKIMVDKIMRYNSPSDLLPPSSTLLATQISNFADWQNVLTFIADDEDGNLHFKQAETLVNIVDSITGNYNVEKLYLDAFPQETTSSGQWYPAVHDALNERVRKGALIVNYTGHGGETGLAAEGILGLSDIDNWKNYYNLPIFITATCEFSRFDNPSDQSAGEHILTNPNGGGVAMFSTTRVAYAHSNMIINTNILKAAFQPGNSHRLGDIMRIGKNLSGIGVYIQNFTLLGDPAMKLAVPPLKVITTSINGDSLTASGDTVYAGQQVTISGYIGDQNDVLQSGFNGEIFPVIFDKPAKRYTLANDPGNSTVALFYTQEDVLFRGRDSVANGMFSFTFTLPKDLSFRDGNGKISYYAKSLGQTAAGYYDNVVPLNPGGNFPGDGKGPDIQLYLNSRGFSPGGITGKDPLLIADIADADGINFFNSGIGHDIVAVIDDAYTNPTVLNDYYIQSIDNSGRGTVLYPLTGLTEGQHKIWLRAWDVLNYSSEAETYFVIRENHELSLNHVRVVPNPMTDQTTFCFDRNEDVNSQWVQISIHYADGRAVRYLEQKLPANQTTTLCLDWDGCAENGVPAPPGVYLYSFRITGSKGEYKQYSGKIVKLQ